MTRKIFLNTLLVGMSVLLLCAVVFFGLQYTQTRDEAKDALRREAVYVSAGIAQSGEEYLRALDSALDGSLGSAPDGGDRITWIAADGHVLYDSGSGEVIE